MKTTILSLVLALVLLPATPAQLTFYQHTLPAGYDSPPLGGSGNAGNWADGWPFSVVSPQRWQYMYDWTQLYHQCPITIWGISFRRSTDATIAGGQFDNVTIKMASMQGNRLSPSVVFDNNLDPADMTTVYTGSLIIPPYPTPTTPVVPAPWQPNWGTPITVPLAPPDEPTIHFSTQFEFDPTQQKDLVLDIVTPIPPGSATGFLLDCANSTIWAGRNGGTNYAPGPPASIADWPNIQLAAIVKIYYTLGTSTDFNLQALTGGGGAGDLLVGFSNIPAGTVRGYTLVSTLDSTSAEGAFPGMFAPGEYFGKGPFIGLWPSGLVFYIATLPPLPGGLFAWTYPTPTGAEFPDVPVTAPPGTLSALAGLTWEVVGVSLSATGTITGISPVRALVW